MQIDPHSNKVHTTTKPTPSWRDVLKIHPAADLFPLMPPDELKKLGADIKKNGLRIPTAWWRDPSTDQLYLLDGRNRLDAMEAAGRNVIVGGAPGQDVTDLRGVLLNSDYWYVLPPCGPRGQGYPDPYAYVISANIHRRHLTSEQKRELIATVLKAAPEKSDRQIAETVKASPTTVGTVRAEMEAKGDVSKLDTRTDTKGRKQPATKPPPPLRVPDAEEVNRIYAARQARSEAEKQRERERDQRAFDRAHERTLETARKKERRHRDLAFGRLAANREFALSLIDAGYRALAKKFHPDKGGSQQAMAQLNQARDWLVAANHTNIGHADIVSLWQKRVNELQEEKRRLEIKIKGYESEIEELRAQLPPGNPGPLPTSLRREAAS